MRTHLQLRSSQTVHWTRSYLVLMQARVQTCCKWKDLRWYVKQNYIRLIPYQISNIDTSYLSYPEILIRGSKNFRINPKFWSSGVLGNLKKKYKKIISRNVRKWSGVSNSWSGTMFHLSEKNILVFRMTFR